MCGGGVIPFIVLFIHWMLWLAYFPMLLDFDLHTIRISINQYYVTVYGLA